MKIYNNNSKHQSLFNQINILTHKTINLVLDNNSRNFNNKMHNNRIFYNNNNFLHKIQ